MVAGASDGGPVHETPALSGNFRRRSTGRGQRVKTLYDRQVEAWQELEEPWRALSQLAWEAYRAGTMPVGAVVAAADGRVVARGRNRIFDAPGTGLAGSRLAHAEVDDSPSSRQQPVPRPRPLLDARALSPLHGRDSAHDRRADRVRGRRPVRGRLQRGDRYGALAPQRAADRSAARRLAGTAVGRAAKRVLAGAPGPSALRRDRRGVRRRVPAPASGCSSSTAGRRHLSRRHSTASSTVLARVTPR